MYINRRFFEETAPQKNLTPAQLASNRLAFRTRVEEKDHAAKKAAGIISSSLQSS